MAELREVVRDEHRDPIPHAGFAIRERGWTVKQRDEANFESVFFKQSRVLAHARVIPRVDLAMRSGLQFGECLVERALHLSNISFAAELRDNPASGPERVPEAPYNQFGFANPVQRRVRKNGIELRTV